MNVEELERLSTWYIAHHPELIRLYNAVLSPIQNNANQPAKQPVEEPLEQLLKYLRSITFEELSLQQIQMLANLNVDSFMGVKGAIYIDSIIRTSEYDPATAAVKINEAIGTLNEANTGLSQYRDALSALGIARVDETDESDAITIRVGFQNQASIDNVSEWRDSARDWYDIIRGLAVASGEPPEATKITGASTGSIILILAGTVSVTTLLAIISKNVASIAKEIIEIRNEVEDLRQKNWLNATIRKEFEKKETSLQKKALKDIVVQVKNRIPDLDGEQITALEGSIKKLLEFNELGGSVDFVAPETDEDGEIDDGVDEEKMAALVDAQAAIREYQAVREQLKLLSDHSVDNEEDPN